MILTKEAGVTMRFLRVQGCIRLAMLAVLLPGLAWAEPPTGPSLAILADGAELQVALAAATEAIVTRAWARAESSQEGASPRGGGLRPEEGFRSGTWHLGLVAGYSIPHKIFQGRAANVHFAPVLPQIGYTVTDVHGPFPIRGSLELVLEPTFLITTSPSTTFGEGASLLFRYNFVTGTRWVPFFDFGPGFLHWNLRLPRILATQSNFTLQGGPGLHYSRPII